MIENYGMFNHHELDNELSLLFSDKDITSVKDINGIIVCYNDCNIVGYKIPNFIRYAKIKYSGIIFLPINILIDVINSLLKNADLETLSYKTSSGYIIKKIDGKKVVYALPGTFLRNEKISQGHVCTYHDLYIDHPNENDTFFLEEDIDENVDFFKKEN